MHNSLILARFFDFLQEKGLFTPYVETLFKSKVFASHFLETLFFRCEPSDWISDAFPWDANTSIDWCLVNNLWHARLNALKNDKSFN